MLLSRAMGMSAVSQRWVCSILRHCGGRRQPSMNPLIRRRSSLSAPPLPHPRLRPFVPRCQHSRQKMRQLHQLGRTQSSSIRLMDPQQPPHPPPSQASKVGGMKSPERRHACRSQPRRVRCWTAPLLGTLRHRQPQSSAKLQRMPRTRRHPGPATSSSSRLATPALQLPHAYPQSADGLQQRTRCVWCLVLSQQCEPKLSLMGVKPCQHHASIARIGQALHKPQEDTAELPDEEIQARIVQLREKLARMEQCIADIDIAIHQKELEEARAGAGHDEAGAPSQQTQPQTDGSAAVVLCSETPSTGTPSLPALRCTDPSRRTSGPLSAHTNMRSQR